MLGAAEQGQAVRPERRWCISWARGHRPWLRSKGRTMFEQVTEAHTIKARVGIQASVSGTFVALNTVKM